ncbi:hypothetical protein QQF64_029117 [Cirrhinus molitorella]|uniref:Uncharacterized protein n=1 Tax=Cirrhinus molitorella TaxID=172907 RepID=A0ABR3N8J4_9TELE
MQTNIFVFGAFHQRTDGRAHSEQPLQYSVFLTETCGRLYNPSLMKLTSLRSRNFGQDPIGAETRHKE